MLRLQSQLLHESRKAEIEWIVVAAAAAAICAWLAVVLIRQMSASLAHAKEEVAETRAEVGDAFTRADDEAVHGLGEVKADISRVQHQLYGPAVPFLKSNQAN
jgi:hypothetical protein